MTTHGRPASASPLTTLHILTCLALALASPGCHSSHQQGSGADAAIDSALEGTPYLSALAVARSGSTTSVLVPAFSPTIHDYYVTCAAGDNALDVSMTAGTGAVGQITQPTTSSASSQQTVSVTVQESEAVVAQAQLHGQHVDYWVRCLPHDFPGMVAEFFPEAGTPSPGYYLIGDEWPIPPNPAYAFILDSHAVPVWYLAQPNTGIFNANTGAFDVDSQVDGGVSFITWTSTNSESPFHLWQFSPVGMTDISSSGWALDPHELQHLPNGDWLLFTDQVQPGVDMTGYGDAGFNGPSQGILPCDILEVDGTGNVVWKWIGTDHLDAVKDNVVPGYQAGPDRRAYADPFHCNSIDVDPANGNLLVSTRMTNSVFYIEKSSGKILWKMGGQTFTKDNAAYVPVTDGFNAAHDARLLPGWSSKCGGTGQISIFDDSSFDAGTARGVIYDVNVGVDDGSGACPPAGATPSWQYKGLGTAFIMGSFRVMPDGDRVLGWGVYYNYASPALTEVDAQGHVLFQFSFTDEERWSYRAIKVPPGAFDLDALRNAVGKSPPPT